MDKITVFHSKKSINCRGKMLSLCKPLVMGILNIAPDSFYDGGKYTSESEIIKQAERLLTEGASIIDVGAVSTRPGAENVSALEETQRLVPVIKLLNTEFPNSIISVDTFRAEVARAVLAEGAAIINDISGGTFDTQMIPLIAEYKVPYIIMHIQGNPQTMQQNPQYSNVIKEVSLFFANKIDKLYKYGVSDVLIDPGFGFGKTIEHNFEMLSGLKYFKFAGLPLVVGVSRKSMAYKLLDISPQQALNATTAMHVLALLNGADILRVHDVKEAVEAIKIVEKYKESTD